MFFSSIKETNSLISKEMSNIYLKLLLIKADVLSFWGVPTRVVIIKFLNFLLQLENQRSGSKTVRGFSFIFNIERNYDVLKPKSPCILVKESMLFIEPKYKRS